MRDYPVRIGTVHQNHNGRPVTHGAISGAPRGWPDRARGLIRNRTAVTVESSLGQGMSLCPANGNAAAPRCHGTRSGRRSGAYTPPLNVTVRYGNAPMATRSYGTLISTD